MPPDRPIEQAYDPDQPFLDRVLAAVERTREQPSAYLEYREDGASRHRFPFWERHSADTVGTKVQLHWQAGTFGAAAQDAFAMNANDLYRERAVPYHLHNIIMTETEDPQVIASIVERLADLSVERGIHMGEGETAILNTMKDFELGVFMSGAVIGDEPNRYQPGDVLIGIPSSGIHSNGLTDARRLFGSEWSTELLAPTRIYDEIPDLLRQFEIHGLTHITGGGFGKMRTLGLDIFVDRTHLTPSSAIFEEIFERWRTELGDPEQADLQMHRKFNNGVGFVIGVPEAVAPDVFDALDDAEDIGHIAEGNGRVHVASHYTGATVTL